MQSVIRYLHTPAMMRWPATIGKGWELPRPLKAPPDPSGRHLPPSTSLVNKARVDLALRERHGCKNKRQPMLPVRRLGRNSVSARTLAQLHRDRNSSVNRIIYSVREYHERTKQRVDGYAAGPSGLDWNNQPDPVRTYTGAPRLELPLLEQIPGVLFADLLPPERFPRTPLNLENLAALLELSLGLSAWKQYGSSRWALRCNPSSGNLHPTEAYVVTGDCPGIASGVHHYVSRDHVLERRCEFATGITRECSLPAGTLLVGLSSVHWREAWKYGERAYRYCQHDAGHAIAAIRYAAAVLGWRATLLASWSDAHVGAVLGTDRDDDYGPAEREHPDLMLRVDTVAASHTAAIDVGALLAAARSGRWQGRANRLSTAHSHHWPVIDEVAMACSSPGTEEQLWQPAPLPSPVQCRCTASAVGIIRQRRSAQAFDGVTSISKGALFRMLDVTLPRRGIPPWDAVPWSPRMHLLLFVHRVDGLTPGLYVFLRNPDAKPPLRDAISADFEWASVEQAPAHLGLFRLAAGDARHAARALSCHQDIAADGAFSLGMLAEYERFVAGGPWVYRQLFWEAGILGQVLYLEAEAAGVRGTGIGCYFDDAVHEFAGITGRTLQSLYHFTVGGALVDTRLQTLPPYAHLERS